MTQSYSEHQQWFGFTCVCHSSGPGLRAHYACSSSWTGIIPSLSFVTLPSTQLFFSYYLYFYHIRMVTLISDPCVITDLGIFRIF